MICKFIFIQQSLLYFALWYQDHSEQSSCVASNDKELITSNQTIEHTVYKNTGMFAYVLIRLLTLI